MLEPPRVQVRRRHAWITLLRFPLSEEQAAQLARGDESSIRASNPLEITMTGPVCEACEMEYATASHSCVGSRPSDQLRSTPDPEPRPRS